jgi:hypothetical protein
LAAQGDRPPKPESACHCSDHLVAARRVHRWCWRIRVRHISVPAVPTWIALSCAALGCTPAPDIRGPLRVVADSVFPAALRWRCPGGLGELIGCRADRGDTTYYYYAHPDRETSILGRAVYPSRSEIADLYQRRLLQERIRLGPGEDCSESEIGYRILDHRWARDGHDYMLIASLPSEGIRSMPEIEEVWYLGQSGCADPPGVPRRS